MTKGKKKILHLLNAKVKAMVIKSEGIRLALVIPPDVVGRYKIQPGDSLWVQIIETDGSVEV